MKSITLWHLRLLLYNKIKCESFSYIKKFSVLQNFSLTSLLSFMVYTSGMTVLYHKRSTVFLKIQNVQ